MKKFIKQQLKKYIDKTDIGNITNLVSKSSTKTIQDSYRVENFRSVLDYLVKNNQLNQSLIDEFTLIFGPHNTTFEGEFFYYVWIIEFKGELFNIFTAKGKGTSFEIVTNDPKIIRDDSKATLCIDFLKTISNLLHRFGVD